MQLNDTISSSLFHATNGISHTIDDYRGKWLVLYFYPKDATPGCTLEGQDFRTYHDHFSALNVIVFGVSRDPLSSHERFKEKHHFPFELISDTDEQLCEKFSVIKMKSMYGKQFLGIERSTFLIDPNGILVHAWRNVKVKGHVLDVLDTIKNLT